MARRPPELSDKMLLEDFCETKSQTAFALLMDRYYALVWKACRRSLGPDPVRVDEAEQAVFCVLALKPKRALAASSLGAWLYKVCRFVASNIKREESRRKKYEAQAGENYSLESRDVSSDADENKELLDACIDDLPGRLKEVIILHYMQGYAQNEVASVLGCAESTVHDRLKKALEKTQSALVAKRYHDFRKRLGIVTQRSAS